MRKVASLGLKTTYNERKGVHDYIRKILALPFLPPAHIQGEFDILSQMATTPELQRLVQYLDSTWMKNSTWSYRQWSVFNQSVRTNNDVEGWHRRLNGKAGRAQLHFYLLVPLLRREANLVGVQLQLVCEQALCRFQRVAYKRMQGRTATLWEQYEAKEVSTSEFLREIGRMYAPPMDTIDSVED